LLFAHMRLLIPVAIVSAFTNNTPIVAMMIPLVESWARQTGLKVSYLLMPLSFATILGGTCTLIGTSTNLIIADLIQEEYPDVQVGFFDVAYIGVPVLVAGLLFMFAFTSCLVRAKVVGIESFTSQPREYSAAVRVHPKSPVAGKTIEQAGLRHLPNVYLYEIIRGDEIIPAPGPGTHLNGGDILYFSGVIKAMTAVYQVDGLFPADDDQVKKLLVNNRDHILVEAVIASHSPLVNQTVKESRFRTMYNAAIICVHRAGTRVQGNIGDISLLPGDTLLLETSPLFVELNKNNSHFSLVSRVEGLDTVLPKQDLLVMLFIALPAMIMVVASIIELTSLLAGGFVVLCFYVITKQLTIGQCLNSMKADLLIIIAAGYSIGTGLDNSGASEIVANSVLPAFQAMGGNVGVLFGLFVITAVLSSFITNAAAVTLMFPIAVQFIDSTGISVKAVLFTLMLAASSSFATAVGYQTNLMVVGPGGYTNKDFFKLGFPLCVISCLISVFLSSILYTD